MTEEPEILFEQRGPLGLVTLNRPKALNALTLGMIRELQTRLDAWAQDPSVAVVAIQGAGEKAFCAGGDVRAVWYAGKEGGSLTREFFYEEYTVNRTIHAFPKPFVALVDKVCMGGGVGLSIHGSHRVVGDKTMLAMPETAIGLFPDVGGSWFLPRLPGRSGLWMALTGARLKAADCLQLGIATHFVPSAQHGDLIDALAEADYAEDAAAAVNGVLGRLSGDPGPSAVQPYLSDITRLFAADTPEAILEALNADGGDWAREQRDILATRSPTSMKITAEQLRRGAELSFDDCMTMEYRMSQACMAGHDFYEGIRAVLVDKDHSPKWDPSSLDAVDAALVERHFAPLGERDLTFND
ncbi:enoyl-CoA hydratase/isomerase family protein [Aquibaculum arenosum]|uniref:3-hydroxyisobutyryl-CoA hydrolase n=1 Tax=Aquibaculum arenosum TaxID=3032591 RepID=A0ABT5YNF5_9PROT|nr:enoyl-CoA hydratase/isomerase family protein [Fodinicurvata sp. CAU 1616]MDF2096484.1 enoyl-CoA hydratase/isomerase family protein [Fodinicurvata sp. CAU 1616]